ncbi:cytochrome P450 [Corynespora cassiicola Philippines]|uniref:Cytochrome P450 n=1 Tax=Corynespora cassiicola Philippines TaxID=1448308 RepID=A0A2T2NFB2_CORCC|nr:cytochrome P450 [Corynespora cassiicola Philippines]
MLNALDRGMAPYFLSMFVYLCIAFFVWIILYGVYNLTLHPLRSYPGHPLWCAYRAPYARSLLAGRLPFDILDLHNRYGPVVRVSPWELSYVDSRALKNIYGHHNTAAEGFREFEKDKVEYAMLAGNKNHILIAKPEDHARLRKFLSPSFSEKGLREMQNRIQSYVDLLVRGLKEESMKGFIDIQKWYNWTTFDMIGDLAFGESFHCLESKKTDPWIAGIFGSIRTTAYYTVINNYGLQFLIPYLVPKHLHKLRQVRSQRSAQKIEDRLKRGADRGDFWDNIISKSDFEKGTGLTRKEMVSTAGALVLGGSETTATLLAGTTYLLLRNPGVLKKLNEEVRGAFKSEDEIDLISVGKLDYMLAVLDEGMRIYPPVANQGNRVVPPQGAMVAGKWVPGGTSLQVLQYGANHSATNFTRPEEFVPERWLADPPIEFANDDRYARQPFSIGARDCIGRNLSYAEMRLILARVCFNFDIELDTDRCGDWMKTQKVYSLWQKTPLYVKLKVVER